MGKTLVETVEKTDRPVVGVIGQFHAQESSAIYPVLESSEVSFRTIPLDSDEPYKKTADQYIANTGNQYVSKDEVDKQRKISME